MLSNLNEMCVNSAELEGFLRSRYAAGDGCCVFFDDLQGHLIDHIQRAEAVVGCVAWLTSFSILDALSYKRASIIVQKEDFLRPDTGFTGKTWKSKLRAAYDNIRGFGERYDLNGTVIADMSTSSDTNIQGVRCVGNHNTDKVPAFPRMHHKFMVFCKKGPGDMFNEGPALLPYAVWTGSFNFTHNATRSFENAVYLTDSAIVQAFFHEWEFITAVSEPLNWNSVWAFPEWRIGT